jgi:hypothetical protein
LKFIIRCPRLRPNGWFIGSLIGYGKLSDQSSGTMFH